MKIQRSLQEQHFCLYRILRQQRGRRVEDLKRTVGWSLYLHISLHTSLHQVATSEVVTLDGLILDDHLQVSP